MVKPTPNGPNGRNERGRFAPGNPGGPGGPGNPHAKQTGKLRSAMLKAVSEKEREDLAKAVNRVKQLGRQVNVEA